MPQVRLLSLGPNDLLYEMTCKRFSFCDKLARGNLQNGGKISPWGIVEIKNNFMGRKMKISSFFKQNMPIWRERKGR
ncbi:hypothetical protein, partial [Butyricicoccus sp.]|uniref:hypothetical protein n=1 Tax=Butyricicoccus sp. TaxID=2049021 RepID=UPI003AAA4B3B